MDPRPCEICHSPGKLICFCRKAILCDLCIGKHFLAEPSLSHKPISLTQTEVARVYEEHIHTLHKNEEKLMEEASVRRAISKISREKVIDGMRKIDAAVGEIREAVDKLKTAVKQQVETELSQVEAELIAKCERQKETLHAALRHFDGVESHADNVVVLALREIKSVEQAGEVEVVRCRVEASTVDVTEGVRKGVVAAVEIVCGRQPGSKLPEPTKHPREGKSLVKSGPGKKPLSKPVPTSTRPKTSQSLNTSAVAPSGPDPALDASKLSKRLGALKQGRSSPPPSHTVKQDVVAERRKTLFEVGHFLSMPEAKVSGAKSDNDVSGEDSEEEPAPMRKFGTEVPDTRVPPRPAAKLTTLQSARAKTRQSLLQETARKVEDIVEQVKGLKNSPKTTGYQSRPFVLPEQQPDPDCDITAERKIPVIMVTDGEKLKKGAGKTGETSLTPTQQLNLAITRASEVSKALISKPDLKVPSPRTSVTPTPPDPALQTYHALSHSKQLKVLSLEANNCSIRTVALPEEDQFGDSLAWCFSPTNKLLLFGGQSHSGISQRAIYEYDPVTGETEAGYVMLVGRCRHTAVCVGEAVYVSGGVGTGRGAMKECEKFDPVRKTTKRIGAMAASREGHGACCYSGAMYVAGGAAQVDFVEKLTVDSELFSPIRVSMVIGQSASVIAFKDRILILHGDVVSHFSPETESIHSSGTVSERDWWSGGQAIVLSRTAYLWLGDGVYRLDGDRSQVERVEGT